MTVLGPIEPKPYPDTMLDTLLKEKPSTRVLKLSGLYHPDSRMFVLNGLEPFQEKSRREF